MKQQTITLYRPTGPNELGQIATQWNIKGSGIGYLTRFEVNKAFMERYPVQQVGGSNHTEWWMPAVVLEELNDNIVGIIEVIGEYHKEV